MIFSWLRRRRRKRLREQPPPDQWLAIVERHVRQYGHLPEALRRRMWENVPIFVAEKHWTGCGGLTVTEPMRVSIAATACLMLIGREDDYCFDGVRSILIYPGAYLHPDQTESGVTTQRGPVYGESWHRGPIVLSWRHVLSAGGHRGAGHNLVVHEFAHHLDGLDGEVAGTPLLAGRQYQDWYRVTEAEYFRLVGSAQRGEATLLDQYGASDKAEFFAVATECFFEMPEAMSRRHEALYGVLRDFYRLDPAGLWPDAPPVNNRRRARRSGRKRRPHKPTADEPQVVEPQSAPTTPQPGDRDADFTLGVVLLNEERFSEAAAAFSRVIEADPGDAEAWHHRGMALLNMQRFDEALADCHRAVALDDGDSDGYRIRGFVHLAREDYSRAVADLTRAVADFAGDAEAYYQRGRAHAGLGDWRRAVADYTRAVRLDPYDAEFYYYRGLAYRGLGQDAKARDDLEKAAQLDPGAVAS